MHPVFGDFLAHAHDDITAAVSTPGELPGDAKAGVTRQLDRLVTTLARYVGDIPLASEFDRPQARQTPVTGGREALEARIALRRSAQVLHSAVLSTTSDVSVGAPHPVAQHLAGAATQLAAGRDLLPTHFSPDPATGARHRTSAWAKVIYTPPVTDALLSDIASMAAQLAPWMMRLSLESTPGSAMPATAGLVLHDASRWLWIAGLKLEARARQQPPPANGRLVLTVFAAERQARDISSSVASRRPGPSPRGMRAVGISSRTCWNAHRLNGGSCQFASVTCACGANGGAPDIRPGCTGVAPAPPWAVTAPGAGLVRPAREAVPRARPRSGIP
jgi:hypothetical protein